MEHWQVPQPILVVDLFPPLLEELLRLLEGLAAEQWDRPTVCGSWTVKDVALHLLGGDIGILSRERDGYSGSRIEVDGWDELVRMLNMQNELWVEATRRLSPRLLCDLLRWTGTQVNAYFKTLDLYATGGSVSWAGPGPAPVWLHVAREYTERWVHQQQIRDAVGRPVLLQPRYFAPVLDAFVRALPHTYRAVDAPESTSVVLSISGHAGGTWFLNREQDAWRLYRGRPEHPQAEVAIDQDLAWRLFTKGIRSQEAQQSAIINGDRALGLIALDMVSMIA